MAGPEVPQPGTIQYNTYTPVKGGDLGGSHLFGGAGQIWAGIGDTALKAAKQFQDTAQMIQASPLNPMVHEQQLAQKRAADEGIKSADWRNSLPNNFGQLFTSTDAAGNAITMAPGQIQDPTTLANLQAAMKVGAGTGGGGDHKPPLYNTGGPATDETKTTQPAGPPTTQQIKTPEQQGGFEGSEYAPAAPAAPAPAQTTEPQKGEPPTTTEMSKTASADPAADPRIKVLSALNTHSANLVAGGSDEQALASSRNAQPDAAVERQPASAYRAEYAARPSSIWSPGRPAPLAPAAPGAPEAPPQDATAQPSTPGTVPGSLSDQYAQQQAKQQQDAQMQAWQNQNSTQPLTADDAMRYMKNKTTLVQDATFMPHGGPQGAPAYAFHMKGGGVNTVPVSQMVQDGAGPMVAAQNTSMVLSASDRLKQQQQNALAAPPDQTQQAPPQTPPNISPPPPANLPPPAPTGPGPVAPAAPSPVDQARQPITDTQGRPLSAYTNVPSRGGLPPSQLGAQTAPAGQPAQPEQQPRTQPRAEDISAADRAALQAQADQMGDPPTPSGPYKGDRRVEGPTGAYTYYRDDRPGSASRGRIYTTLPGIAGRYYTQQRWYPGTNTYENYELPDSAARQELWDKWGKSGFLTRDEVDNMQPEKMSKWLQRAWQVEHLQNAPIDSGTNLNLTAMEQSHKNIQQIRDMMQTLASYGITDLGTAHRLAAASENVGTTFTSKMHGGVFDVANTLGGMFKKAAGELTPDSAALIRALDQKVQEEQKLLDEHAGMLINPGKGGGQQTPNLVLPYGISVNLANIPNSTILEDTAFSGQDIKEKLARFDGWGKLMDQRYNDMVEGQHSMMYRVDPKQEMNSLKALQGMQLDDPSNQYKDHKYPSELTPAEAAARARSSTTDQFPTIPAQDLDKYRRDHPGGYYYDDNHALRRAPTTRAATQ